MRLSIKASEPAEARSDLGRVADTLGASALWDLKSVVTELVTLCRLHGAWKPIPVEVALSEREVEGVVECPGAAKYLYEGKTSGKESFAVRIIAALTSEWGTDPIRGFIWFKMPVDPVR
jgi:hypothetical protein